MLRSKARLLELNSKLAEALASKGVEATADETTTALVNKVADIETTIVDNKPEFLKEITLTDDVNAITVDLSDYIDKYYMFLIYPDLQFSKSEWLYIYHLETGRYGYYRESTSISVNDDINNLVFLINSSQLSFIMSPNSSTTLSSLNRISKGFICSLYKSENTILSGSTLKIYGVKGDVLNVDL